MHGARRFRIERQAESLDGKDQSQRQQKFVELLAKIEQ